MNKKAESHGVQMDGIWWLKGDNPVQPKAPPVKGTPTAVHPSVFPQQTLTEASQARPGGSLASNGQVKLALGVSTREKDSFAV